MVQVAASFKAERSTAGCALQTLSSTAKQETATVLLLKFLRVTVDIALQSVERHET